MPKLRYTVTNLSDEALFFIIDGYAERCVKLESPLTVTHDHRTEPSFVTRVESPHPIEPGRTFEAVSQEIKGDLATLHWYAPLKTRTCFYLHKFTFGDCSLIKEPGRV